MAAGGRKALRGLGVLLALGLSVAAVLLIVFGKDARTIRVGVILGAWGLMFGGLSLYPRRNAVAPSADVPPVTSTALELRDDAAARREFERVLQGMLHRELDRGLRPELDSLRGEMAGLRGEVGQAMRNQVSLERVETRIVGADLGELQDEVRRNGPTGEPKPALLASQPKPPNPEITEVMAAVREDAPPPVSSFAPPPPSFAPPPPSFAPPAPAPAPGTAAPVPTPRPAWSPSSVDVPSLVFNPLPPPAAPVRPPVTPAPAPLGARRVPPVGAPRPTPPAPAPGRPAPTPAPAPVPQFAVPGPPVWTGPSSVDLTAPARPVDSTVPRSASSPSFGNGTSLLPRPTSSPAPQEMRWPWQEETKRAADSAPTPLAPRQPPLVPSVIPPARPGTMVPPSTPTNEGARPAITRSDPFAGLPRLTPVSELDLPELLPDLPPPPPPAPWAAAAPVTPFMPAAPTVPAPGSTSSVERHSDALPEAPTRADVYVGRRRAGY
jgi:hypothetical protein